MASTCVKVSFPVGRAFGVLCSVDVSFRKTLCAIVANRNRTFNFFFFFSKTNAAFHPSTFSLLCPAYRNVRDWMSSGYFGPRAVTNIVNGVPSPIVCRHALFAALVGSTHTFAKHGPRNHIVFGWNGRVGSPISNQTYEENSSADTCCTFVFVFIRLCTFYVDRLDSVWRGGRDLQCIVGWLSRVFRFV